jgi:bifunctional non-homologous end joining protein LigD
MKSPRIKVQTVPGARKAAMPRHIEPMKAVLVDKPFDRKGWIFEEKYDGIRALSYIRNGKLEILSRNQKPMTMRYPELADMPKWVNAKDAILDGEIIVLNKRGTASFSDLQSRFGVTNKGVIEQLAKSQKIVYFVFDILYLDGYDLMPSPLLDRKAILKKVIRERIVFRVAPHTSGNGIKRFKNAERRHLEGIIAKNGDSHYEKRRSSEWLKIKTTMRQEAVIVGYTMPQGSREYFGALHLGLYDGKRLVSVGKVGTGFDRAKLKVIFDLMKPLKTKNAPFDKMPSGLRESVQWLKPKLVCEIKFTERTREGSFRHPAFVGLRFDKKPIECTFEAKRDSKKTVRAAERAK